MLVEVKRICKTPYYTIGKMSVDGKYFCDVLEDCIRKVKIYGKTAIPAGTYEVVITYSNRFKKLMPLLLNVQGFEGVRIHSGNTAEDTSGCLLVGRNTETGKVTESRFWYDKLFKVLSTALDADETIKIKITD